MMTKKKGKHKKFRENAGSSAPELPDFDEKSQKNRQFGVLTNFLVVLKNATLATLCRVKRSQSDHGTRLMQNFSRQTNLH